MGAAHRARRQRPRPGGRRRIGGGAEDQHHAHEHLPSRCAPPSVVYVWVVLSYSVCFSFFCRRHRVRVCCWSFGFACVFLEVASTWHARVRALGVVFCLLYLSCVCCPSWRVMSLCCVFRGVSRFVGSFFVRFARLPYVRVCFRVCVVFSL